MKYIESNQNPRVKKWKKLLTKKEREKSGQFLVEGFHLVEEALTNKLVDELIIRMDTDLPLKWDLESTEIYQVTDEIFSSITDTETPQGVVAVCKQPNFQMDINKMTHLLLIDRVQDPGNIGTMIRTADAAGFNAVILGEGCADLYSPKVVRSTQGSLFHLPIIKGSLAKWITKLKESDMHVLGTALQGAVPYREMEQPNRFALLMGNEGSGVSDELLRMTTQNVYIPILGKSESLNVAVAAGILMYGLRK